MNKAAYDTVLLEFVLAFISLHGPTGVDWEAKVFVPAVESNYLTKMNYVLT